MATDTLTQQPATQQADPTTLIPAAMAPLAAADGITAASYAALPEAVRASIVSGWTAKIEAARLKAIQDAPFALSINSEGNITAKFQGALSGSFNGPVANYEAIAKHFDTILVPFVKGHIEEMAQKAADKAADRAVEKQLGGARGLARYLSAR